MKENISKNKVWQIVGVSVLCAVLVLGAVLGVVFGMNHSSEDLNVSKDMSEQDGLVISQEVSKGITLMSGVATTAADGTTTKTITATVEPAGANEHDPLSWDVAFKDPSSTWANGKTVSDYVTISVSADTLTCTVTCKQAFGEQIVLNVSSKTKNATASASVDYLKRVVGYQIYFNNENGDSFYLTEDDDAVDERDVCGSLIASETSRVPEYTITWEFSYSIGTIEGNSYLNFGDGKTLANGGHLQLDEQSSIPWVKGAPFDFALYYNGSSVGSFIFSLVEPVRSISVGNLVF